MKNLRQSILILLAGLSTLVSAQEVELSMDHPSQVRAGEEFTLTIAISKGSLTDYSRFSQDLPLGLTASNVSSPNADFSFDKQRVRVIWLKLPEQEQIQVSYRIRVDERLKGEFSLGGVFAYVVNDERKFLNMEDQPIITITPSSTMDPEMIVDIKDFAVVPAATGAVAAGSVGETPAGNFAMAIRQVPALQDDGSYLVYMLIKNNGESKFIRIEEELPSGYIFEEVESSNGIVAPASTLVKYIWMKVPSSPEFEISYRLAPRQGRSQADMIITGKITYTSGTETLTEDIKQMDVVLASLNAAQKSSLLAKGSTSASASRSQDVTQPDPVKEDKPIPPPAKEVGAAGSGTAIAATAGKNRVMDTYVLSGGKGVTFRVQLIAKKTSFDASAFFREAGVREEVLVEQTDGFYKYTAGSFTSYDEAVAYKNRIQQIEGVEGPFVVAYRDGQRVPVSSVR